MKPPPLPAQLDGGPTPRAARVPVRHRSPLLSMSASAPRFDAVAANAIVGVGRRERKTELLFHRARQDHPRTLCCCQSVACIISSMLAPSGWLSSVSTRSCLVDFADLWFVNFHWRLGGGDSFGL